MRAAWAIRGMLVLAIPVAMLERSGKIHTPTGVLGLVLLIVLLMVHFLVVARIARRNRRR